VQVDYLVVPSDEESIGDSEVYINLYDITYRLTIDSHWLEDFLVVIQGEGTAKDKAKEKESFCALTKVRLRSPKIAFN